MQKHIISGGSMCSCNSPFSVRWIENKCAVVPDPSASDGPPAAMRQPILYRFFPLSTKVESSRGRGVSIDRQTNADGSWGNTALIDVDEAVAAAFHTGHTPVQQQKLQRRHG